MFSLGDIAALFLDPTENTKAAARGARETQTAVASSPLGQKTVSSVHGRATTGRATRRRVQKNAVVKLEDPKILWRGAEYDNGKRKGCVVRVYIGCNYSKYIFHVFSFDVNVRRHSDGFGPDIWTVGL